VVYDELYSSVKGSLTDTVFDEETWDSVLSLDGLEQHLEDRDRGNKSVMAPAKDLYKRFVTNDDDTAATDPMSDSDSDCDSVTLVSEGEEIEELEDDPETSVPEGDPSSSEGVPPILLIWSVSPSTQHEPVATSTNPRLQRP
jgi:hypothetical protein